MAIEQICYTAARPQMKPGDVIAFGGKGHFSEIIKFATLSDVSHVGVILQTQVKDDSDDHFFNQIIESTSLNGFNGVNISRFSDRLDTYDGELWWLPLHQQVREKLDTRKFYDFLFNQAKQRKAYDMSQAIKSALDMFDNVPGIGHSRTYNTEDFSKFFCSELVAAGLEVGGAIDSANASEVTPIDLCMWKIYSGTYYQLKGNTDKKIKRYNTASPSDWNE